jgi:hypothetical protein
MVDLQPKGRCVKCQYDLRGITSKCCPECGTRTDSVAVRIMDSLQYHRARAALDHHGLLLGSMDPGGSLGSAAIAEGIHIAGWVWVDPDRIEEVEACLDSAGVFWQVRPVPIVDRSDPTCPSCLAKLNGDGPEECPNCGDAFQWVDIEEPPVDPTAMLCRQCGYELTGNLSGRCPECDWQIGASVDQLVAAATQDSFAEGISKEDVLWVKRWAVRLIYVITAFALMAITLIGGALIGAPSGGAFVLGMAMMILGFAGLTVGVAVLVRLKTGK